MSKVVQCNVELVFSVPDPGGRTVMSVRLADKNYEDFLSIRIPLAILEAAALNLRAAYPAKTPELVAEVVTS